MMGNKTVGPNWLKAPVAGAVAVAVGDVVAEGAPLLLDAAAVGCAGAAVQAPTAVHLRSRHNAAEGHTRSCSAGRRPTGWSPAPAQWVAQRLPCWPTTTPCWSARRVRSTTPRPIGCSNWLRGVFDRQRILQTVFDAGSVIELRPDFGPATSSRVSCSWQSPAAGRW